MAHGGRGHEVISEMSVELGKQWYLSIVSDYESNEKLRCEAQRHRGRAKRFRDDRVAGTGHERERSGGSRVAEEDPRNGLAGALCSPFGSAVDAQTEHPSHHGSAATRQRWVPAARRRFVFGPCRHGWDGQRHRILRGHEVPSPARTSADWVYQRPVAVSRGLRTWGRVPEGDEGARRDRRASTRPAVSRPTTCSPCGCSAARCWARPPPGSPSSRPCWPPNHATSAT